MATPRNGGTAPNANLQYSTLPEVIPGFGNRDLTLPEVRHPEDEKMLVGGGGGGFGFVKPVSPSPSPAPAPGLGGAAYVAAEVGDNTDGATAGGAQPNWFRRQRKWVLVAIAAAIVAIVVAVVVGVVVGTKNSKGGNNG